MGLTPTNGDTCNATYLTTLVGGATVALVSSDITGLTAKATPAGADTILIYDAAGTALKKLLLSNARVAVNQGTVALTDGANIATDCSTGNVFTVTLGGNRTFTAPTNQVAGATYIWRITQDATGSRTGTFNSVFKWPSGVAPTLTTTANANDIISGVSDGTNIYCTFILDAR